MNFKTTIIIAILLAALGGYAYYFEYKGGEKKEEAKEKEKTLFEVKKEDVRQIQMEGKDLQKIVVVASGKDTWQITQPMQTRADESTVDRILGNFEKLKYKEIIEEKPSNLSAYELKPPHLILRLDLKGNTQRIVSVGAKNPVNNVYYIQVNNDPKVYLTEGGVGDLSTITLQDLRDKKLTDFTAEKVESLNLHTTQNDLQFKRENGVWKMIKPVTSPASDTEITSLLSSLETLRATRFVDQPSADLTEYGLKTPTAVVELVLEKGLRQKLEFGKVGTDTYCRIEGSPSIAAVGDSLSATFDKKVEDWREKKALIFNRFDVEEFQVKAGGKDYSFKKAESDKWTQLSPSRGEVDYEPIQSVLEKLENAEISKYGEQPALTGAPVAEVFLTMKDWQEKITKKHLAFGPVAENSQQVKNDDYSTVIFVDASLVQELQKAVSGVKAKPPTPPTKKP
jgi:hypothetical protein